MKRVVAIGEVMLELSATNDGWAVGAGGDTFNTAVHGARSGMEVAYLTAIGADPFSDDLMRRLQHEGVDTSLVLRSSHALPGLYAIRTDAVGERSFYYWRQNSAVRTLFAMPGIEDALTTAARADLLYLSGITLSLFDETGRRRLAAVARDVRRNGGKVAFDPNYRPAGWSDRDEARRAINAFSSQVDIALPTFDDERLLHDDADPGATVLRWRSCGASEIVVKIGPGGCLVDAEGRGDLVAPARPIKPVDTTGAGDSFNAAYLTARLKGDDRITAANKGNALAGIVIRHRGAIGEQRG